MKATVLNFILMAQMTSAQTRSSCPYSILPNTVTNVLISDKLYCSSRNTTCTVNKQTCKYTGTSDNVTWSAIGSYKDIPSNMYEWSFNGGGYEINIDLLSFPDRFSSLKFSEMTFPKTTVFPTWPKNLTDLTFSYCSLVSLPPTPPNLKLLFLAGNKLTSNEDLRTLSKSIVRFSLQNNQFTEIADLDWTRMNQVYLHEMSTLTSIVNVSFSSNIRNLNLGGLSLNNWIMDNATFLSLNKLQPNTTADNANYTDGSRDFIGYHYYGTTIYSSPSKCQIAGGVLQEIWADKSKRAAKYASKEFIVCVIKDLVKVLTPIPTATSEPGSLSTGAIVGIAVGCIAVVIGALVLVFVIKRKNENATKTNREPIHSPRTGSTNPTAPYYPIEPPHPPSRRSTDSNEINLKGLSLVRLDVYDVVVTQKLGSGAFADVCSGHYRGKPVAIKMLHRDQVKPSQIQTFVSEIELMASFNSPYIVKCIGACWTRPNDLKCVMELMDSGDLKEYLETHSPTTYSWQNKCEHILHIVEGLVYLHSMNIIHRDLKSKNVLINSKRQAKLTDFGISREDIQATMTVGVGTFRWMAPEVLQQERYTVATDIYSFGVMLSEFDTHRIPYSDLKHGNNQQPIGDSALLIKLVQGTIQPSFTANCPRWIHDIALQCLSFNPKERPTAMHLSFIIHEKLKTSGDAI